MKCVDLERRAEAAFLRHRGVYRLAELPEPSRPDLLVVARRVPRAMICLISALSFHGLTTQIPHDVWLRGSEFGPQFRADN